MTLEVLKFETSKEVKDKHLLNKDFISMTLVVLKLLKFKEVNFKHPENIEFIFVI